MQRLQQRTFDFSMSLIESIERLPNNYIYQTIGKQLLRAGTSIGANIIEAQAGSSRRDFANYYQIALKSANETVYWLSILKHKLLGRQVEVEKLLVECKEICSIVAASLITLKGKRSY